MGKWVKKGAAKFFNHFEVFGYPDETLFLLFEI